MLPREEVDEEHAEDVREEIDEPDVCAAVGDFGSEGDACPDRDDFDKSVYASEEGGL